MSSSPNEPNRSTGSGKRPLWLNVTEQLMDRGISLIVIDLKKDQYEIYGALMAPHERTGKMRYFASDLEDRQHFDIFQQKFWPPLLPLDDAEDTGGEETVD
jgi:hypothetical protein